MQIVCFVFVLVALVVLANCQIWQLSDTPFYQGEDRLAVRNVDTISRVRPALSSEFTWSATVEADFSGHKEKCSATLIDRFWVLTAGHCVFQRGRKASQFKVDIGRIGIRQERRVPSRAVILHPYYPYPDSTYNFAMIFLGTPVGSPAITPITLPSQDQCSRRYTNTTFPIDGCATVGTSAGWIKDRPNLPLQKTIVPLYNYKSCQAVWKTEGMFSEATICGGGNAYGDVCVSDRGGGLMCRNEFDEWFLAGVASFGDPGCQLDATRRLPAVYSRVCAALGWITDTIDANRNLQRNSRWSSMTRTGDTLYPLSQSNFGSNPGGGFGSGFGPMPGGGPSPGGMFNPDMGTNPGGYPNTMTGGDFNAGYGSMMGGGSNPGGYPIAMPGTGSSPGGIPNPMPRGPMGPEGSFNPDIGSNPGGDFSSPYASMMGGGPNPGGYPNAMPGGDPNPMSRGPMSPEGSFNPDIGSNPGGDFSSPYASMMGGGPNPGGYPNAIPGGDPNPMSRGPMSPEGSFNPDIGSNPGDFNAGYGSMMGGGSNPGGSFNPDTGSNPGGYPIAISGTGANPGVIPNPMPRGPMGPEGSFNPDIGSNPGGDFSSPYASMMGGGPNPGGYPNAMPGGGSNTGGPISPEGSFNPDLGSNPGGDFSSPYASMMGGGGGDSNPNMGSGLGGETNSIPEESFYPNFGSYLGGSSPPENVEPANEPEQPEAQVWQPSWVQGAVPYTQPPGENWTR